MELQEDLIPHLPNYVTIECVIPRIPWYIRPVLMAVSKAWRSTFQRAKMFASSTREFQRVEGFLLIHKVIRETDDGASSDENCNVKLETSNVCVCGKRYKTSKDHKTAISLLDPNQLTWRRLPPVPDSPNGMLEESALVGMDGRIFVIGGRDPETSWISSDVYMLDIGSGLWEWEKRSPMHLDRHGFCTTRLGDMIFVVGGLSSEIDDAEAPEIYDIQKDQWLQLEDKPGLTPIQVITVANQVYVFGTEQNVNGILYGTRIFDFGTEKWTKGNILSLSNSVSLNNTVYKLTDGVLHRLHTPYDDIWTPLEGKLPAAETAPEGKYYLQDIIGVVDSHGGSILYTIAIIQANSMCTVSLWRGELGDSYSRVTWRAIDMPFEVDLFSSCMAYLS